MGRLIDADSALRSFNFDLERKLNSEGEGGYAALEWAIKKLDRLKKDIDGEVKYRASKRASAEEE